MVHQKSDKLKKLDRELKEAENWLELGMLSGPELEKHLNEIIAIKKRREDEINRLKNAQDTDDDLITKKVYSKNSYDSTNIHDMDHPDEYDLANLYEDDSFTHSDDDDSDDDDPFSAARRWSRKNEIQDPESDDW